MTLHSLNQKRTPIPKASSTASLSFRISQLQCIQRAHLMQTPTKVSTDSCTLEAPRAYYYVFYSRFETLEPFFLMHV